MSRRRERCQQEEFIDSSPVCHRSVTSESTMLRGMWTSRLRPEALDLVDLVVGEVALEPEPARYTCLLYTSDAADDLTTV